MSRHIVQSIEVAVPRITVFEEWADFASLPALMDNVETIEPAAQGAARTHWKVRFAGISREFDAEITEIKPGHMIAWRSVGSQYWQSGAVAFVDLGNGRTRMTVQIDTKPAGALDTIGEIVGIPSHLVRKDLVQFRHHIERRLIS